MNVSASASPQVTRAGRQSLEVTDQLTVTPVSDRVAELAGKDSELWTEADLRVFIREETRRLNGPQLPVQAEDGIISDFWGRHGANAARIARHVFEAHEGKWHGAPVTVRRFAATQDEFFAIPLLKEILGS